MGRRLAGIAAIVAVFSAPVVAKTELVCRYTGQVIVGCSEAQIPEQSLVLDSRCCLQRLTPPLAPARADESSPACAPVLVLLEASPMPAAIPDAGRQEVADATASRGPPIFLAVRNLLI